MGGGKYVSQGWAENMWVLSTRPHGLSNSSSCRATASEIRLERGPGLTLGTQTGGCLYLVPTKRYHHQAVSCSRFLYLSCLKVTLYYRDDLCIMDVHAKGKHETALGRCRKACDSPLGMGEQNPPVVSCSFFTLCPQLN